MLIFSFYDRMARKKCGNIFADFYMIMTKKQDQENKQKEELVDNLDSNTQNPIESQPIDEEIEVSEIDQLQVEKDKYLRLYSEFENFRRRTTKERLEWMQTASKDVILNVLPIIDDMERALKSMETANDISKTAIEGMELIYKKLYSIMEKTGLKPMNAQGQPFDPELHEAITEVPVPDASKKGKVIDEVTKGYYLNDKIIRFAKVVVGK
jgi:molecular chaperone GrpE